MVSDTRERPIQATTLEKPHEKTHKQSLLVRIIIWVVVLLVFALAGVLVLEHRGDEKKGPAGPVKISITTARAHKGNIGIYLDAIGTVTPVYTDSITSQVTGQITAVHFTEGQIVNKGDPLIDIDPRPYAATLLEAQGALERDQNLLAQAQMDLERYQQAWNRNAIAKQTLDDQQKLVLQDQGTVKNDQGTVNYDQVQLDFCHITSPIAGRVGLRLVDPGNVVQSTGATTLAVITQLQPITVIFTIAENNIGPIEAQMRKGTKLKVDASDANGQTQLDSGELITLDNQIDTATGTVKARALFPNKDNLLFPNLFVNTRLLVKTVDDSTLIPASAIQQNGQNSFVYVIKDNVAHMKSVKPGVTDDAKGITEVQGIDPGDVVANSSFDKLQDNVAVSVSARATSGPSTAPSITNENSAP